MLYPQIVNDLKFSQSHYFKRKFYINKRGINFSRKRTAWKIAAVLGMYSNETVPYRTQLFAKG